jgi:hypothetical protein
MLGSPRRQLLRFVIVALSLGISAAAFGQASQSATEFPDSRVDLYGGYGYFHPVNSGIDLKQYFDVDNANMTIGLSGFFNRYIGVEAEAGYFSGVSEHSQYVPTCSGETCSQLVYTAEGGPVFRLPLGAWIPFVHALGGGVRNNGPASQPLTWGWGVTGGGGLDYVVPFFKHHLAVRLFQADWQYSQVVYGPLVLPEGVKGGFGELDALKLSGGLVLKMGEAHPAKELELGCTAQPAQAYPGDVITINGTTVNFDSKRPAAYTWKTNGGRITPQNSTATINTAGLAPGEYTVSGHIVQGMKARQQSNCMTPFTIKPFEPPTLTCSATPSTANSGTVIDISTVGTSPQNRPLTYSYSASAGQITSEGPTAKLSTAGLGATTVTVTCNVVDDLGQTAQANTQVTLTTPVAPVVPQTQELCHMSFERDRRRADRVDNEAKGCLDDIALTMEQQGTARLVMVGNSSANERPEAGAERALNARDYLVREKGIDQNRIDVRTGHMPGRFVTDILVPPGATFDPGTTAPVDENTISRHGQPYGGSRIRRPAATTPHANQQPRRETTVPRPRPSDAAGPVIALPRRTHSATHPAPAPRTAPNPSQKPAPKTVPEKPSKPAPGTPATPNPATSRTRAKPAPGTPMSDGAKTATRQSPPAKKSTARAASSNGR